MKKPALWLLSLSSLIFFFLTTSVQAFASDAPTLKSPASASTTSDTNPTLSWAWSGTCPTTGDCFRIQVDDQADFSSLDKNYSTTSSSYSPHLTNGLWYWRVEAKEFPDIWSQIWSFTVDDSITPPTPPSTPPPSQPVQPVQPKNISLSEFMPNPDKGNEWVEIYNGNDSGANLGGWKIDDGPEGSSASSLGDSFLIGPKALAVFYFNSKLNNDGDTLRLLKPDGTEVEVVNFGKTTKDVSFAKDTKGTWRETLTSTPGQANIINTGEVLAEASSKNSKSDEDSTDEIADSANEVVRSLSATSSSHSGKPINTKAVSARTSPNIFLPVIFVGSGMILLFAAAVAYLIKIGVIKKVPFRKAKAPDEDKSPPSA